MMKSFKIAFFHFVVFAQMFIVVINATTSKSSTSNHDQSDPSTLSSFEDALIYPKQAISPYHIEERASDAFVKQDSNNNSKNKLKQDKRKHSQTRWKQFRKSKQRKTDITIISDGRSANSIRKHSKHLANQFKSQDVGKSIKERNTYANQYPIKKSLEKKGTKRRIVQARHMTKERILHLSSFHTKQESDGQ